MAKTILIVDDSASIREVVRMTLEAEGWDVIEAEDGQDALTKMSGKRLSLILSDVHMPKMDGISFLSEVKKDPGNKYTPVIMLTTESAEGKKEEGKAAGAKAWMVKPFKPDQILAAVAKLAG